MNFNYGKVAKGVYKTVCNFAKGYDTSQKRVETSPKMPVKTHGVFSMVFCVFSTLNSVFTIYKYICY